jgi:hypothetical protein
MIQKIRYAILDDVEQVVVVIEDGSLSTAHYNDEFIVVNWYPNKIPSQFKDHNIDERIWRFLDNGKRYWKHFYLKQEVDEEVIAYMLNKLYGEVDFEKDDEVECFCEKDLKYFLYKN